MEIVKCVNILKRLNYNGQVAATSYRKTEVGEMNCLSTKS